MSTAADSSYSTANPLGIGDSLAEAGDWAGAVQAWNAAVSSNAGLQPAVERRISWFLEETGHRHGRSASVNRWLVLGTVIGAVLATVIVVFAGEPGTSAANLWALAAWLLIVVSTVAAILAARRPGAEPYHVRVARARLVANGLDANRPGNGRVS